MNDTVNDDSDRYENKRGIMYLLFEKKYYVFCRFIIFTMFLFGCDFKVKQLEHFISEFLFNFLSIKQFFLHYKFVIAKDQSRFKRYFYLYSFVNEGNANFFYYHQLVAYIQMLSE